QLLTEEERQQVLFDLNATAKHFDHVPTIHALFERQVQLTPDAVALEFQDRRLTYSELNARANCLAIELQARGVGPEVLVAICAERSLEMVIAVLGVLKSGGAYVALDPEYPRERLSFMLSDAGVRLLLTHEHLQTDLPTDELEVIYLSDQIELAYT